MASDRPAADDTVPDAHDPDKRVAPMMLTTDLALRFDPIYEPISRRFHENPDELADAFARAWFKLTHRDMGPVARTWVRGSDEELIWQDPVPAPQGEPSDPTRSPTSRSGSSTRGCRCRNGGYGLGLSLHVPGHRHARRRKRGPHPARTANGWEVNIAAGVADVVSALEQIQANFNGRGVRRSRWPT